MLTDYMNCEGLLQHLPDPIYINPTKLPYINTHQPLCCDNMTEVDYMVNPVTPVPALPAVMPTAHHH